MKKFLGILVLGLLLSACTPDPKNFIGMDNSWIKPLATIFVICAVVVGLFLIWFNKANKENNNYAEDDLTTFLGGLSFLAGPGLITAICYIVMVISGFLIISFFSNIILTIAILFGVTALVVGYLEDKKK